MDGKLLCYLCTSSLKRALEKSKQTDQLRHGHSASRHSSSGGSKREATKRPHHRVDVTKHPPLSDEPVVKQPALTSKLKLSSASEDPTSDHMIQIAALKEEIAKLNKQIGQMNQGMLEKDKQITQLKAQIHNIEQDYRRKAKDTGASHGKMVEEMSRKIKELQRQNAVLSKGARKADRSLNKAVLDKTPVDVPATGSGPVSADASSASNSPVI
ncbi:unnamed protein product [Cyprideis torosa]|uniref:Uncharacterized protein n=1 Tax=Cyprideis torosa TaxID=163714 RepID=A0A7R8ZKY8_9CRUS|nr:unnamed protein product [Cyprideis torosa]CAG0882555.1 unnamed protein product [Cyprideis torosa]